MRPAGNPDQGGGQTAVEPLVHRHLQQISDKRFPGSAQQQGIAEHFQFAQPAQQFVVIFQTFSKADPGIDDQIAYPLLAGKVAALRQVGQHFFKQVRILRFLLHGARGALHVHQHQRGVVGGGDLRQAGIAAQGGDVVDDMSALPQGPFGDFALGGIDGDQPPSFPGQPAQHRRDPLPLGGGIQRRSTRAGALAPDIDDIRAGGQHRFGLNHCAPRIKVAPAVAEGIRGNVENAHDLGALDHPFALVVRIQPAVFPGILQHGAYLGQ